MENQIEQPITLAPVGLCKLCHRAAKTKKGICFPCKVNLKKSRELDVLARYSLSLDDDERTVLGSVFDDYNRTYRDSLLSLEKWEEIVVRYAAGEYRQSIIASFRAKRSGFARDRGFGILINRILNDQRILKIVKRLRGQFSKSQSRELVPITNPFMMAVRLEALYLQAEANGNIRDGVMVLKAASEILGEPPENKNPAQTNNFLTIIQRIQNTNQAERALKAPNLNRIEGHIARPEPVAIESDG